MTGDMVEAPPRAMSANAIDEANLSADVQHYAMKFLRERHPRAAADAAGRVVLAIRHAAARNPQIYTCTPESIGRAVAQCVEADLVPGGALPLVWLIPRRNGQNGPMELNWQISVRGLEILAKRAGYRVRSVPVFASDHFAVTQGLRPDITHEPDEDAPQTWEGLRGVYVVSYPAGSNEPYAFEWVPKATIARLKAAGKAQRGPWDLWPVEMARARAVGYALRRGVVPMADDAMREAVAAGDGAGDDIETTATTAPAALERREEERQRGLSAALGLTPEVTEVEVAPVAKPEPVRAQAKPPAQRRAAARDTSLAPGPEDFRGSDYDDMPG